MSAIKLREQDFIKIINKRDPRYDGRFYFGVKTTHIYCRPVCPARPKPENIIIFKGQAEAQNSGFRPCKRCRPDESSVTRLVDDKSLRFAQIQDYIESHIDSVTLESLSHKFLISERQLRRIFQEYVGAPPHDVINSHRLSYAKKLLISSKHSITKIAYGVGFSSLRSFNRLFKEAYQITPREMRSSNKKSSEFDTVFTHQIIGDFDWKYILEFLKRHSIYGQEFITDRDYKRIFLNEDGSYGFVFVGYDSKKHSLVFKFSNLEIQKVLKIFSRLKFLFDLNHNPYFLPTKSKKALSIRVPTSYSPYEVAVSIVIGQLVSTEQAEKILYKLITKFGTHLINESEEFILFPKPNTLIESDLSGIGLSKLKINAIKELSRLYDQEAELFYHNSLMDEFSKRLSLIKGVGPWTVSLILMRCLGDIDYFPKSDLIIKRALDQGLFKEDKWIGYRAYLTHLIWRDYAHKLTKKKVKS